MKICMVTHDFPPQVGGIAAHVYELSNQLARLGHEIFVLTPQHGGEQRLVDLNDGVKVEYVKKRSLTDSGLQNSRAIVLLDYIVRAGLRLRQMVHQYSIDIVHYHNLVPESLITKALSGTSIIFTAHESHFLKLAEMKRRRIHYYLKHINFLIAPSQELLETAQKYCHGLEGGRYIPNGVDIERFSSSISPNGLRQSFGISEDEPLILSARRLVEKNGVIYLIESIPYIAEAVTKFKIMIVGNGEEAETIRRRAKELKVEHHIIWAGEVQNSKMPQYYAMCDLVTLPSLKEATSITGLEAMACGKPLVGTTVGGIPYLIDNKKTGMLVPPRDPASLGQAIGQLIKDNNRLQSMGLAARRKTEDAFAWPVIAQSTLNAYKECQHGQRSTS